MTADRMDLLFACLFSLLLLRSNAYQIHQRSYKLPDDLVVSNFLFHNAVNNVSYLAFVIEVEQHRWLKLLHGFRCDFFRFLVFA